jgi:hypothetical protein
MKSKIKKIGSKRSQNHLVKIKKTKKINNDKNKTSKIAICLLAYQPSIDLIELYDDLYRGDIYDIYVIVDDNKYDISELIEDFPEIQFIKIKEETCIKYGYTQLNFMVKNGEPSAWDKGIYYFCEENKINYKYIWFLEDDVFIPNTNIIKNIDEKYGYMDLLLKRDDLSKNGKFNYPFNQKEMIDKYMNQELKPYLAKSMVCAIRISDMFIKKIKEYKSKNKTLFFLEFFIPTLAKYYNLKTKKIDELQNIVYRKLWTIDDIFKEQKSLFHPVKKVLLQKSFRKTIKPNEVYFLSKRIFKKNLLENKDVEINNMNLLQIIIFKNESGSTLKLIQDTSINENNLYLEIEKKHGKNKFTFKLKIESLEEIEILISLLKYKFFAIQTVTREHYIYKNNVNIYFTNIPGVIEFIHFESYSENKLKEAYNNLGYQENEIKTLEEVIEDSDKVFSVKTDLNMTLEFEKYEKALKYVKKNKELFKKLVEKQYKTYKSILELFGDKVKIYDKLMFI